MKKKLSLLLVLLLVVTALAACGGNTDTEGPESDSVKTGLAILTTVASSTDAGEDLGLAQGYSNIVAVIVDEDGVIANCAIDAIQTNVNFDAQGHITSDLAMVTVGKQELGDSYGMKKASTIGKEWFEQANFLAEYVIGMTRAEVLAIPMDQGLASDSDLSSGVTMHVNDYVATIVAAMDAAQDLGANSTDTLGIGTYSLIDGSVDATADEPGNVQVYAHFAAVTFDEDGVITSAVLDASQADIGFGLDGVITTDLATVYPSKDVIKDGYGMKKASSIGKEWYEQAAFFASYVVGKTVDEVKGIAMDKGLVTDADLASGVTMHANMFVTNIAKAFDFAK